MHYYQFNPADFNNSASHLTLIERAIYRDLLDMYYCTEKAIDGSDDDALARRLLCKTEEHFEALRNVLDEFFTFDKRSKRYRNRRCETEIKNYRHKHRKDSHKGVTSDATDGHSNVTQNVTKYGVTMTAAERQQKLRQERKQMADDLVSIGVSVSKSLKTGELRALHAQHIEDIKQHVTKIVADNSSIDVTSAVTNRHKQCHKNYAQNGAITINQEPTTNNQLNNYNSSNSPVNEKFDVEFWQPSRTAIQPLVSVEVPAMPSMTQAEFDKHLSKFKKYRINQKTAEGEYIATEDYCTDLFVSWIKREYIHDQRNKTITAKPKVITQTSNRGYLSLGKAPLADDSDIPAAFFQGSISSSKPTQAAKPSPKTSVTLNGCWFAPLPNMDVQETYTYIANQQDAGETQDETYKRVLDQMQEAV